MSFPSDRWIRIELMLRASQPELLEGLDVWLKLGLLSDDQVKQLCQQHLSAPLPHRPPIRVKTEEGARAATQTALSKTNRTGDFAPVPIPTPAPPPISIQPPSWISRMLQSLMAELSVRWLLFLGVFMVVVSSGLLAASQWERFPAFGQYGVLLTYTLIFWGVSFWAGRQSNLQLTAQTLQLVTLLLVPVNFWAMDAFGLWQHPLEWLTVAIATLTLTSIAVLLFNQPSERQKLVLINYLGLSYLHWGWTVAGFPLIAVYIGIIGTTSIVLMRYATPSSRRRAREPEAVERLSGKRVSVLVYAVAVLLMRAIFVAGVEIAQLGLAIAICGWLLAWLSQKRPSPLTESPPFSQSSWEAMGGILLGLGWLVSVWTIPGQALAASGLGLWFFASRLQRFWRRSDLAAFFAIGWQMIWLVGRLIPPGIRTPVINTSVQITHAEDFPGTLLSLTWFPYLIFMLGVINWLNRRQKTELARFGDQLALGFGVFLTLLGLFNPAVRSLNLLASTITLAVVTWQRPSPVRVYLTHLTGLLALISFIHYPFLNLNPEIWTSILLTLMVAEWGFSIMGEKRSSARENVQHSELAWYSSAWYIGLGLAGLSYLLVVNFVFVGGDSIWGLRWLVTPLALTGVASQTQSQRRQLASGLSFVALILVQVLTLTAPSAQLISWGVATLLMLANTRYLPKLTLAMTHVGFGLIFYNVVLWEGIPGLPPLSSSDWLVAEAIALTSLWLLRGWAIERRSGLATLYAKASDIWAIGLCVSKLVLISFHALGVYEGDFSPSVAVVIALLLTMAALLYRSWRQPSDWAVYALGWGLELLTVEGLAFTGRSLIHLAIANVALGLITQLSGDWWQRRTGNRTLSQSWHALPLIYGFLGLLFRWSTLSSWTGLSTLAIALIAIGVGRRRSEFKPLLYLGLLGVSVAAYELLLYQVLPTALAAGLIAMAALSTSILYAYRVLSPWLRQYLHMTAEELTVLAHLHWVWSSCLFITSLPNTSEAPTLLALGTGAFLAGYAIFQGRNNPNPNAAEIWIYLGLLEIATSGIYLRDTPLGVLLTGQLLPWVGAIACLVAYFLYLLPWERWGWSQKPWQKAAIVLPLAAIALTIDTVNTPSLTIAAGFYLLLARLNQQIRLTYLSGLLIDWALWHQFWRLEWFEPLCYVTPLGLTLLYIAQVDPTLKLPEQKNTRHQLRLLGSAVICVVALWTEQWTGLIPGFLSLMVIFAGLAFRIRAFLYIGTATFLWNAFVQLVILNSLYSFIKWIVGLLVGIALIWIAANFETRREQIVTFLRHWLNELASWE